MAEKITLPVVNLAGKKVGTVELASEIFGITEENAQVIHDAVVCEQANARQATAKTKSIVLLKLLFGPSSWLSR